MIIVGLLRVLSFLVFVGYTLFRSVLRRKVKFSSFWTQETVLDVSFRLLLRVGIFFGRLKMETKWWETSKTPVETQTIYIGYTFHRSRSGFVQWDRNQHHKRNRMYIDVHDNKSLDVDILWSHVPFPLKRTSEPVLHCIWNGSATDAECQHATFILRHVHVDMHYFNTLILLELGKPKSSPSVLFFQIIFPIITTCSPRHASVAYL